MSHLLVENEADMEYGLGFAYAMAVGNFPKNLEITFSSGGMANIFLTNLFSDFIKNRVPENHGLNLVLNVPDDQVDQLETEFGDLDDLE
jgi:hypothetical protein